MEDQENGTLSVSAPNGWRARLQGLDTKAVLFSILLAIMFAMIMYQWEQDRQSDRAVYAGFADQHKTTHMLLRQVLQNQEALTALYKQTTVERREDINEMTYVLSLPQDKREKLRLEMPNSLRRKMNEGGQP